MTFGQNGRQPNATLPHIAIISSGRPGRVSDMRTHLGPLADLAAWYVGADEGADYAYAGARNIVQAGTLSHARNTALEVAFKQNKICVQLSDDLTGVDWCRDRSTKHRIALPRAIGMVVGALEADHRDAPPYAMMAGAAATDNPFFMPKEDFSRHVFIIGDLMAVAPNPLRFDERLSLKEDLDYSIQHLKFYGTVLRVNTVLANWQHRTNYGGAVQYRTVVGEQEAIDYIATKHPGWTKPNPNRPNELLLRWPPVTIEAEVPS